MNRDTIECRILGSESRKMGVNITTISELHAYAPILRFASLGESDIIEDGMPAEE